MWLPGPYEYPQDGEMEYPFTYRRLTADELTKVSNGDGLWDFRPYCVVCHKSLHPGQELILEYGYTNEQGETSTIDESYCTKCYQEKLKTLTEETVKGVILKMTHPVRTDRNSR